MTAERADDCVGLEHDLEYIVYTVIQNLPVATSKLTEFKEATALDSKLQTVVRYCQHEWPRSQKNVPVDCRKYIGLFVILFMCVIVRGGVEDTRLEAKAKDTKKIEAKDSLSEDRHSRGQGQECSRPRPRTKDTRARALQKKKVFPKIFQAISEKKKTKKNKKKGLHKNFSSDPHEKTSSKKFFKRSTKF